MVVLSLPISTRVELEKSYHTASKVPTCLELMAYFDLEGTGSYSRLLLELMSDLFFYGETRSFLVSHSRWNPSTRRGALTRLPVGCFLGAARFGVPIASQHERRSKAAIMMS